MVKDKRKCFRKLTRSKSEQDRGVCNSQTEGEESGVQSEGKGQ